LLARLYYKLKRNVDAERERAIIDKLTAEEQKSQEVDPAAPPSSNDGVKKDSRPNKP
jgi:chorismate mutase